MANFGIISSMVKIKKDRIMNIFKTIGTLFIVGGLSFGLSACNQTGAEKTLPKPATLVESDIGHSDQMIVVNHKGPKSQIHLANTEIPLWFSSVRDGLAYLRSPEQSTKIIVFYVSDAGATSEWNDMGNDNWINANDAFFVVGSDAIGGMGAPAFVPFSDETKAKEFASNRGGEVIKLSDINAEMVLTPVNNDMMKMNMDGMKKEDIKKEGMNMTEAASEMVMEQEKKSD